MDVLVIACNLPCLTLVEGSFSGELKGIIGPVFASKHASNLKASGSVIVCLYLVNTSRDLHSPIGFVCRQ